MITKLIHYNVHDTYKKKIIVILLWLFILCLPVLFFQFIMLIDEFIPKLQQHISSVIFFIFTYIVGIGILFRVKFLRLFIVFITYISLAIILAKYIEKSLRLYSHNDGCFTQLLGYGIDYDALIYPEKILSFFGGLFLIIVIYLICIYIFSNEESLKLFLLSKKYRLQEIAVLLSISSILFAVILWFLINKHEYMRIDNNVIQGVKINLPSPPSPRWNSYKPDVHEVPIYKVKFEKNATSLKSL